MTATLECNFNWPASDALIVTGECEIRTFLLSTQTVVEDRNVEFLRITNVCICNELFNILY